MQVYGYPGLHLAYLLFSLMDRFAELTRKNYSEKISLIVLTDENHSPLAVDSEKTLKLIRAQIPLNEAQMKKCRKSKDYPFSFPFSLGIPLIFEALEQMINQFYMFSNGLAQQSNEIDDLLKKILEDLLVNDVNTHYKDKLAGSTVLSIAVQLMLNSQWMSLVCTDYVITYQGKKQSLKGGRGLARAAQAFEETRVIAEQQIFTLIKTKIYSFLELIEYDWAATTSRTTYSPVLIGKLDLNSRFGQLSFGSYRGRDEQFSRKHQVAIAF